MKDAILNVFKKLDRSVSYTDLMKIDGFKGDIRHGNEEYNIFLWFNCSDEAIKVMQELLSEDKIAIKETTSIAYQNDIFKPKHPVAKQQRKYKKARWWPVLYEKGPNLNP